MKLLKAIIAGFAGATVLNILHEGVRRFNPDAPRVDLLGEEALSRSLNSLNINPPQGDNLYAATLVGDLLSNTIYYSAIGMGGRKNILLKGAVAGLTAGIGAVKLPEKMGLDDKPVTKTTTTKILTVTWYLVGGIATALVFDRISKK
ncbi:hypothetical protein [Pedobacter sandarakinus]|uniref:hypothetical protein n=1 Tax=Pedobacter sandarakinus TaxID=353156 RepID=UPI0022481DB3|nr:hypothetical protein [Pedobacter sandarakinus]MCX2573051.1 hypothetical protein [Pedobacter sandarakinus]